MVIFLEGVAREGERDLGFCTYLEGKSGHGWWVNPLDDKGGTSSMEGWQAPDGMFYLGG